MINLNLELKEDNRMWISVGEELYTFRYERSNNGIYILAYDEFSPIPGVGNYILLKNNQLSAYGSLIRPNDGKVGDNGNFIFNDWLNNPKRLAGIVYAFNELGEPIVQHKVKANLLNNGLSASGKHMVFQTCNSGNADGNIFVLYNLEQPNILWKQRGGQNW